MSQSVYFGIWDWAVVAFTLAVSLAIGLFFGMKKAEKTGQENDLLMGNRKMKPLSIAVSMLVTYFSAIAVIGYPSQIFTNGIQVFFMNLILSFLCIPTAVGIFVIVLQKLKLTSVYEFLELRYKSKLVRCLASLVFILETLIITGVALYTPAIPLHRFCGLPPLATFVIVGLCGTFYTSIGGLKAVIYTDCFQFILIILGLFAIVWRGVEVSGGFGTVFEIAEESGRLNFFDTNVDLYQNFNTLNLLIGYGLSLIWFYGAHQPNFQRYSSLPTLKKAVWSMLYNVFLQEVAFILIILSGLAIVAVYVNCDPLATGEISKGDEIVSLFVEQQLSFIPGMMGLFVSCILSAVLSTISSALNSMAAVTWEDFLLRINYFSQMGYKEKQNVTVTLSFCYGILVIFLAYLASMSSSIFQLSIVVLGSSAGAVGGAFIMALFIPCTNYIGVTTGMFCGLVSLAFISIQNLLLIVPHSQLPTTLDGCPDSILEIVNATNPSSVLEGEYNEKHRIYSVSIVLFPVIGAIVTSIVGTLVSIGVKFCGLLEMEETNYDYLHPSVIALKKILSGDRKVSDKGNEIEVHTVI